MRLLILSLFLSACASRETKRERLQADFPECFVTYELEVICPQPEFSEVKGGN